MIQPDISADSAITPFDSLVHLKERHEQLLSTFEDPQQSPSEDSAEEIRVFVRRVTRTGAHISSPTNRALAQNIIDFWNGYLLRHAITSAWPGRPKLLSPEGADLALEKEVACPYVGLSPLDKSNRQILFGRKGILADLLRDVSEGRNVVLSGPSGCGKSSLLRAGLQFDLEQASYEIVGPIAPGRNPTSAVQEITKALVQHRSTTKSAGFRTILILDQFEEVFTICDDREARDYLGRELKNIVAKERLLVIVAVRSDYEEFVLKLPSFSWLADAKRESVPSLDAEALRQTILEPARRVHLDIDEEVCNQLVTKTVNQVSGLPLLQFALVELWDHREKQSWSVEGQGRISMQLYMGLGGSPSDLLNHAADRECETLPNEEQRRAAKDIFLELVQLSDTLEITSRPQPIAELKELEDPERVSSVVEKLLTARLLRKRSGEGEETAWVEISHEALIRNWGQLRTWISEDRANTVARLKLRKRVKEWLDHGRSHAERLTAEEIAQYSGLDRLKPLETNFLNESRRALKLKSKLQFAAASVGVVVLGLLAILGWKAYNAERKLRSLEERNSVLQGQRPVARITEGTFSPLANEYWESNVKTSEDKIRNLISRTGIAKTVLLCKDDAQKESAYTEGVGVWVQVSAQTVLLTPRANLRPSPETNLALTRSTRSLASRDINSLNAAGNVNHYCVVGEDMGARLSVEFVQPDDADDTVGRFYTNATRKLVPSGPLTGKQDEYLRNFEQVISVLELTGDGIVRKRGEGNRPRITNEKVALDRIRPFSLPSAGPSHEGDDRQLAVMAGFVSFLPGHNEELAGRARELFPNPSGSTGGPPQFPADQFWLRFGTLVGSQPDELGFFIHDCIATETDVGAPVFDLRSGSLLGIDVPGTPVLGNIPVHQPAFGLWQLHGMGLQVVSVTAH